MCLSWSFAHTLSQCCFSWQLSQTVHKSLGAELSAHGALHSPVRQLSKHQAHISQALDAISLTAQVVCQQQQYSKGSTGGAQNFNACTIGTVQPQQLQSIVFQQVQSSLAPLPQHARPQKVKQYTTRRQQWLQH